MFLIEYESPYRRVNKTATLWIIKSLYADDWHILLWLFGGAIYTVSNVV